MNKYVVIIIALLVILGGILAVSDTKNSTPQTSEPIVIGTAFYPGFGATFIAQEKGFFEDEGVNVEALTLSSEAMIPSFESNEINMVYGTPDFLTIIADVGIEASQIFSISLSNGADGIITTQDIKSVEDLRGKKVYLGLGFPSHFFLRSVTKNSGIKSEEIEIIDLNPDQVGTSFLSGEIIAGVTWEPWLSKATQKKNGKVLISSKESPGIITDVMIAHNDLIQTRREDVKKIMRAIFTANKYWEENTDEGNEIVARHFNLSPEEFAPMRDTVLLSDYELNLKKFDPSKPLNAFELFDNAVEIYQTDGIISSTPHSDDYTDNTLLKELYE